MSNFLFYKFLKNLFVKHNPYHTTWRAMVRRKKGYQFFFLNPLDKRAQNRNDWKNLKHLLFRGCFNWCSSDFLGYGFTVYYVYTHRLAIQTFSREFPVRVCVLSYACYIHSLSIYKCVVYNFFTIRETRFYAKK